MDSTIYYLFIRFMNIPDNQLGLVYMSLAVAYKNKRVRSKLSPQGILDLGLLMIKVNDKLTTCTTKNKE